MTVVIFIVILAVLVFVHELGHFLAAKASGIRVDEFAIGFPPKVFSFKRGETTYSINLIPFGGFVKIFGENPNDESINGPDNARSFVHKPKSLQALVLIAGIAFNILFAWILISFGFMRGMPVPQDYIANSSLGNAHVTVVTVMPNSPAEKAGLKSGDTISKLQSGPTAIEQFSVIDVQDFISNHKNQAIALSYARGAENGIATITPAISSVPDRATIGVELEVIGLLRLPFFNAMWQGGKLTASLVAATAVGIVKFLYQALIGTAPFSQVAGPVGIASLVGDATRLGFVYLLSFAAFISINLAIVNLIPFPALDGGRLLFVLIEKIKGSPIKPQIANVANAVGFALLILLMIVITYHDIVKLIAN